MFGFRVRFGLTGRMADPTAQSPASGRRGSYAKGLAKREEILTRALEVIAREGYRGASVKEIADAVGLSQAGLLHYFDSKEELFTEILRKRDEIDAGAWGMRGPDAAEDLRADFLQVVRHNSEVPGLVELFSRLAVDATDPSHPAHTYFLERGAGLRSLFGESLVRAQRDGRITDRIDPEVLTRLVQAIADGMQLQWLLDRDVDMTAPIAALFELIGIPAADGAS